MAATSNAQIRRFLIAGRAMAKTACMMTSSSGVSRRPAANRRSVVSSYTCEKQRIGKIASLQSRHRAALSRRRLGFCKVGELVSHFLQHFIPLRAVTLAEKPCRRVPRHACAMLEKSPLRPGVNEHPRRLAKRRGEMDHRGGDADHDIEPGNE